MSTWLPDTEHFNASSLSVLSNRLKCFYSKYIIALHVYHIHFLLTRKRNMKCFYKYRLMVFLGTSLHLDENFTASLVSHLMVLKCPGFYCNVQTNVNIHDYRHTVFYKNAQLVLSCVWNFYFILNNIKNVILVLNYND